MNEMLALLWRQTLVISLTLLVIFTLRALLRRFADPRLSYACWLLLLVVPLASLLPLPSPTQPGSINLISKLDAPLLTQAEFTNDQSYWPEAIFWLWFAGLLTHLIYGVWQYQRLRNSLGQLALQTTSQPAFFTTTKTDLGPMLIGVFPARIVMPADFFERYTQIQQALILAHEGSHLKHLDPYWNWLFYGLRCIFWFQPLFILAQTAFSFDQELACDARVMRDYGQHKRDYAEAMLTTLLNNQSTALICHWSTHHPLKERIMHLKQSRTTFANFLAASLLAISGSSMSYLAWANADMTTPPTITVTDAANSLRYKITSKIEIDGASYSPQIKTYAGSTSQVEITTANDKWRISIQADAPELADPEKFASFSAAEKQKLSADKAAHLKMHIYKNGKLLTSPVVISGLGHKARIEHSWSGKDNGKIEIELQVSRDN